MALAHDDGWSVPIDRPFYAPLPCHYRDVVFHFVFFRSAPSAVARLLPEPLEAAEEGDCVACGLDVPFSSNYGAFQEAFLLEKCAFRGRSGWFCSHVFHNGPAGIAAGREIYGTPKFWANIEVKQSDRTMVTTAGLRELPAITITSSADEPCDVGDMPELAPSWRLKLIPRADRPGPAIKQLIDGSAAATDVQIQVMMKGTGTVWFDANPLCDLTGLRPLEVGDAFHMTSNYTETYARIEYDYLEEE
jgi:acetoacetate decarboxylase